MIFCFNTSHKSSGKKFLPMRRTPGIVWLRRTPVRRTPA